jgi:hypothetical protein
LVLVAGGLHYSYRGNGARARGQQHMQRVAPRAARLLHATYANAACVHPCHMRHGAAAVRSACTPPAMHERRGGGGGGAAAQCWYSAVSYSL